MTPFFTDKMVIDYDTAVTSNTENFAKVLTICKVTGIYSAPSQFEAMFVSMAHSDEDIDYTCDVIKSFKL